MKLTENVYFYPGVIKKLRSSANTYLIKKNGYFILIDPGVNDTRYGRRLLERITAEICDLNEIKEIWLTHAHPDHAGGINYFLKYLSWKGIKIFCHPLGKMILESKYPMITMLKRELEIAKRWYPFYRRILPLLNSYLAIWLTDLVFGPWREIKVNYCFKDEEVVEGIKVFYLPGHTPDSLAFFIKERKILISGDFIDTRRKDPAFSFIGASSDLNELIDSAKKIIELEPEILAPGHGPVIKGGKKIKKLLEIYLEKALVYRERAKEYLEKCSVFKVIEFGKTIGDSSRLPTKFALVLGFVLLKTFRCPILEK